MKKFLANLKLLRFFFIPLLKKINFEFKWQHDITKRNFYLQTFNHKGYWYYGKKRDLEEYNLYKKMIHSGQSVLEIGTHIGYLTQVFEMLVGKDGSVLAVEPSPKNIYFLKKNILSETFVVEKAASNVSSEVDFYTEEYGGFTNSLIDEFTKTQNISNNKNQFVKSPISNIKVQTDTIDNICKVYKFYPNFIKIDVEGAELLVLKGALNTLPFVKSLMVEISFNKNEILQLLSNFGFKVTFITSKSNNYFFTKNK